MPAFGKNGIYNLNNSSVKKMYKIVKSDGTVVMSCDCKEQLESHIQNLSQKLNCELKLIETDMKCI